MSEEDWRPLGVDSEDEIAAYDALHDGVPDWMRATFWAWVRAAVSGYRRGPYNASDGWPALKLDLTERLGRALRIALPDLQRPVHTSSGDRDRIDHVVSRLQSHHNPLAVADYLLAFGGNAEASKLEELLSQSNSAWTVGTRAGRPGLVPRVPEGVQLAADGVMANAGMAGKRLARAWEALYQLDPNPSAAYGSAIKAVEDAAVPVVSPTNKRATLGTVIDQMEAQKNWTLPMDREHTAAPTKDVVVGMMRMLWHGQHDRHGGQPSAPGDVSYGEANVAVLVAVTLVGWFDAGLVARR